LTALNNKKFLDRLSTVLIFRQFVQHLIEKNNARGNAEAEDDHRKEPTPKLSHQYARLFFTENPEHKFYRPEFATFYVVRKLGDNIKGIKIDDKLWFSVEHYYQAMKLNFLAVEIPQTHLTTLIELFRTIESPQKIFDFVRQPITDETIRVLLDGEVMGDKEPITRSLNYLKKQLNNQDINH